MPQYVYEQIYNLFIFIICGIIISFAFDVFRIFRKSFKTPDFITYIEDILFWVLTSIFLLFMIFKFNNGEIRGFIFLGIAIGSIIYLLTLSKPFIKYSVRVILFFKKILRLLLIKPIYLAVFNIKKVFIKPINCIKLAKSRKKAWI